MTLAHVLLSSCARMLSAALGAIAASAALASPPPEDGDLLALSLEQLANVRVIAASRSDLALWSTPAQTHVIRREDILRSGATTIAEALRLAPGVEVARVSGTAWAITLRGFNGDLSNKLLVLVDGRSVYSPLFGGVYWDMQDYLLEDVERIEVVGGPGGALWGANAVNGVINVVTRAASAAPGASVSIGGGNEERRFAAARVAGALSVDAEARAYLKYAERDAFGPGSAARDDDDWDLVQGGGRVDWRPLPRDRVTVQGDVHRATKGGLFRGPFTLGVTPPPPVRDESDVLGANLLARWQRAHEGGGETSLQTYVDYTQREIPGTYDEARLTADVDFQQRGSTRGRHGVLWGGGVRVTRDRLENTAFATFVPARRTDTTLSAFVQDRIALVPDAVFLTLGSKVERNDVTGWELQPSARLWWGIGTRQAVWAAVSRAVRTPARLERDLRLTTPFTLPNVPLPLYVRVDGDAGVVSEELVAYEAGYRVRFGERASLDATAWFHDYDELVTQEARTPIAVTDGPQPYVVLPNVLDNLMRGHARGTTIALNLKPSQRWRVQADWTWTDFALRTLEDSNSSAPRQVAGRSPRSQYALHSYLDLPGRVSLYVGARRVGELPTQRVRAYTALDVSVRWEVLPSLQLSLTARNAADAKHQEFGTAAANTVERSVYGTARWRF